MKAKHLPTLFLFFVCFCFFACQREDDIKPPPVTGDGTDTTYEEEHVVYSDVHFYCYINGEYFQSHGEMYCQANLFDYYPEAIYGGPEGYLVMSGLDCNTFTAVLIRMKGFIPQTGYLNFLEPTFADSCFPAYRYIDYEIGESVIYEDLIFGHVNFTEMIPHSDTGLGVVEGTFAFDVTNEPEDSVISITDGHFRFRVWHTW